MTVITLGRISHTTISNLFLPRESHLSRMKTWLRMISLSLLLSPEGGGGEEEDPSLVSILIRSRDVVSKAASYVHPNKMVLSPRFF